MSQNKSGDSGQTARQTMPDAENPILERKTGSPLALRILFAVLFFGCTGFLLFSEILLTVLRMMGINP